MKRKLIVTAFILAFGVASVAQAQSLQIHAAEQELRQLDAAYYRNYLLMKKDKNRDIAFRNSNSTATSLDELVEKTFTLMMLGDDRAVRATYIAGELAYEQPR